MKLIHRDTDYALRALMAMARDKERVVSVSELAGRLRLPRPYLRKILQALVEPGILASRKGKGGGFLLGRPVEDIRLAEVLRVYQEGVRFHDCLFRRSVCPDVPACPLRATLGRLQDRLVADLESITLASLAKDGRPLRRKRNPHKRSGKEA